MKMKVGLVVFALAALFNNAFATDIQSLVQETQRSSSADQHLTMAWWIPQEFWQASLSNNPNITADARAQLLNALDDYQLFVLVHAKIGAAGITDAQSKDELVSHAQFVVAGKNIDPIPADKLPPSTQAVLGSLKPALVGMLGAMGQSMQIIVYPSKRDGVRLIDTAKASTFQYTLYDQTFQWRMPLASLLPKKIDPKTNEEFPGNYEYNPYTGGKLTTK